MLWSVGKLEMLVIVNLGREGEVFVFCRQCVTEEDIVRNGQWKVGDLQTGSNLKRTTAVNEDWRRGTVVSGNICGW